MNRTKVAIVGVIALALSGVGVGAAVASTGTVHQSSASVTAADPTDAVIDPNEEVDPTDAVLDPNEAADPAEASDSTSTESASADDGNDGGHEDPDGVDVQHEGGADEK